MCIQVQTEICTKVALHTRLLDRQVQTTEICAGRLFLFIYIIGKFWTAAKGIESLVFRQLSELVHSQVGETPLHRAFVQGRLGAEKLLIQNLAKDSPK